ncbi:SPOR domain-containing protein [Rhodanobacter sp. BL-MT-08]
MAPRKGKGRQAVRNNSGGFPGWGYAVIGILVGAIMMAVVMRGSLFDSLHQPEVPQANPQATAENGSDPGVAQPPAAESAPKKPQFDFYSVLSEKEVRIPDAVISAQARAEQQKQATAQQQAVAQPTSPTPSAPADTHAPAAVSETITAAPAAPASPSAGSGYLLQVGAFPNPSDAETLKAKLAMQGFVASVQSVSVGGQAYHRVRLGPFRSATDLESTKQRLASAGINAIALKEGK